MAIHCQGGQLEKTILLLDEPENYIHPGAIIEVLEILKNKMPNGQIWIATHSVSILAHFVEQGSIWYMDKGQVRPAGKIQEKVLHGLLGNPERIARQIDFLEAPERIALLRYAGQCLSPPNVVMTGPKDPQVLQVRRVIDALYETHGMLKVLDFGAGKGRLLANLYEDFEQSEQITSKIDYFALDKYPKDKEACEFQIQRAYGHSERKWFSSYSQLLESNNKGSFHVVIMCNVLHEINPTEWHHLFGPTGEITEILTSDGYLLLVEDHRIPIGENAHDYGFLVMDTCSIKDLFAVRGDESSIIADAALGGRLKSHLIPKGSLSRYNDETQRSALRSHQNHARSEIVRMRKDADSSEGRLFGFWVHQFANATMAMS